MAHKFRVGDKVELIQAFVAKDKGIYEITGLLPAEHGSPQYRVKNSNEPHQRVVREDFLVEAH